MRCSIAPARTAAPRSCRLRRGPGALTRRRPPLRRRPAPGDAELASSPAPGAEPLRSRVRPEGDGAAASLAERLLANVWVVERLDGLRPDFRGVAVTRSGRVWSPLTRELRQVPGGGEDRLLAERNRRDELVQAAEGAAQAEQAAIAEGERASQAVAAADAARDEADRAARTAARARDEASEAVRHAGWLLDQRKKAPDEGPTATRRAQLGADDCGLAQPVRGDPRVRTDHVVLSTRRLYLQRGGRDHHHRRPDPCSLLLWCGPVTRSAAANRIILVGANVGAVAYSAPSGPTVLDLPGVRPGEVERRELWADGSAVFYAWRTDGRWALLPTPEWLSANAILVNALTWGTLVIELAIAVLVWNRRWRFWVLAAGVVMHVTMMLNMNVGFFSVAMFVLYLAFVPADALWTMPGNLKTRWRDRRRSSASPPSQPVDQSAAR